MLLCVAGFVVSSCNDDDNNTTPTGLLYSYFPTNVGHEIIYDVSLITKDQFSGQHDTDIYQMKEVVESVFIDNQNRPTQRLERYRRNTPNDSWVITDVWTSNLTATWVEKKEENIPYVKLVFPITSNGSWNGNVLNTLDDKEYEYENLHEYDMIGGIEFDSTITVLQSDFDDIFNKEFQIEKYAPGVGLIYKEDIYILKDPGGIKEQRLYIETISSWSN